MRKVNHQGILEEVEIVDTKVYLIFTKAGNYRGGKVYDKEKRFVLSTGRVELTTFENNINIKKVYFPGEIITIGANIPNLFYFPENSEMTEWFDTTAKSTYFEPFKKIKNGVEEKVNQVI